MNSSEVMKLLRAKYSPPAAALIEEVRDGTGYSTAGRLMDAMGFGLWPSRGLEIHGFEIKVYRNDWLRELKQPAKAESFYKFVDRWYILAGGDDVVKVEELPKTWGLMIAKGDKLRTVVEAPIKKATPCSRIFMMAIIRRITESYVPKGRVDEIVATQVAQKVEDAVHNAVYGRDALQRSNDTLTATIADFEKRSGVRITEWNREKIGDAVRIVAEHGAEKIIDQYGYLSRRMAELAKEIAIATDEARAALDTLKTTA
jgi:hypothetical protein